MKRSIIIISLILLPGLSSLAGATPITTSNMLLNLNTTWKDSLTTWSYGLSNIIIVPQQQVPSIRQTQKTRVPELIGPIKGLPVSGIVDIIHGIPVNNPLPGTNGSVPPVPEPATILLMGTGIAGVGIMMRRRPVE